MTSNTPTSAIIEAAILVLVCTVSILGNSSLFFIFTRRKQLRTTTNGFLLNLAFADLLVSVLNMPITVVTIVEQRWIFGETACVFLGFTTVLTFVSSVMSLAMIAINRYYFVVQWKTYPTIFTKRRSVLFGTIVWFISVLMSFPPLFGWSEYAYIPGKSFCFVFWPSDVSYLYFMVTIYFCGPLTITCLTYLHILKFTRNAKRRVDGHKETTEFATGKEEDLSSCDRNRKRRFRMTPEEVKITNTLIIVVACFTVCWAPFAITMFTDVYYPRPIPRIIDISTLLLGYANSMCNPIVYGIRNRTFRRELVFLFTGCYSTCLPTRTLSAVDSCQVVSQSCLINVQRPQGTLEVSKLCFNVESSNVEATTSNAYEQEI